MGLKLVTDASAEPVSSTTAKLWTKIEDAADDSLVTMLITDARKAAEDYCGRYFAARTVTLYLDEFPDSDDDWIELPRPPITSIDHVKYTASDGTLTTIGSTNYSFEQAHGDPPTWARLIPAYSYSWPTTRDIPNAVEIQYQCGYSTCPSSVIAYILAHVAASYGHRELIARADRVPKVVDFIAGKLDPYKIWGGSA